MPRDAPVTIAAFLSAIPGPPFGTLDPMHTLINPKNGADLACQESRESRIHMPKPLTHYVVADLI